MAPRKPMRSPFGLFMTRMKMVCADVRAMPIDTQIAFCNDFYKKLSPEVMQRFHDLSTRVKAGMHDREINRLLAEIDIGLDGTAPSTDRNHDEDMWDDPRGPSTSVANEVQLGFDFTKQKKKEEEEEAMDSEEDEEEAYQLVEEALAEAGDDLKNRTIVVICFNVLIYTFENTYHPNEVGLTRMSLADGLQDSYTNMIGSEMPEGYYSKAKDFSDNYHKIPIVADETLFKEDIEKIYTDVYHFMSASGLKDKKGRTMVFCKAEDKSGVSDRAQVRGCLLTLEKMFHKANEMNDKTELNGLTSLVKEFVVCELSDLLFLTGKKCCQSMVPRLLATDALNDTKFDYYPNIRCEYHEEMDNNYCALAVVKRSAYLFLDRLFAHGFKPELEITPKPEHRPKPPEDNSTSMTAKFKDIGRPIPRPSPQRYYMDIREPPVGQRRSDGHSVPIGIGRARSMNSVYSGHSGRRN